LARTKPTPAYVDWLGADVAVSGVPARQFAAAADDGRSNSAGDSGRGGVWRWANGSPRRWQLGTVVLAAYSTGNFLPSRMPTRVFVGYGPETVRSSEKQAMVRRFFRAGAEVFRQQFLADYHIDYLFHGPAERALSAFEPETAPWLQLIYDNGPVQIYRVD
jgi:hypothetical protein